MSAFILMLVRLGEAISLLGAVVPELLWHAN
jgi:hypothetical protein